MSEPAHIPPVPRDDLEELHYATLRGALSRWQYSESVVLARTGAGSVPEIFESGYGEQDARVSDPLDLLIRLFLIGRGVARAIFAAHLEEALADAWLDAGLLRQTGAPARLYATVSIPPSLDGEGLWYASDRVVAAPEAEMPANSSLVYPVTSRSCQMFLGLLPRRECERFAEVCAGCGPAAVLATEFANEVYATDIEARAVAFARYNARLNQTPNLRAREGSIYANLPGAFDLIAAHPPYMPAQGDAELFYGGGIDGTQLLRQLVEQLPGKLKPGGVFYCFAMVPEGAQFSAERRIRQWLGSAASSFDVLLFPFRELSLGEVAHEAAVKLGTGPEAMFRYRRTLMEMGIHHFFHGALLLRLHAEEETPRDVRRQISSQASWAELLWCLDWETGNRAGALQGAILENWIQTTQATEVLVSHRATDEGLQATSCRAVARYPFEMESQVQGWMGVLLGMAGRRQTGRALMESAKREALIHPDTPEQEFAQLLATFVSGGFLESGICPLPTSPRPSEAG